jgi:hypothetical protein
MQVEHDTSTNTVALWYPDTRYRYRITNTLGNNCKNVVRVATAACKMNIKSENPFYLWLLKNSGKNKGIIGRNSVNVDP